MREWEKIMTKQTATVMALILGCLLSFSVHAKGGDKNDEIDFSIIGDDFNFPNREIEREFKDPKRIFLVGKTIKGKFQLIHYNDEDFTGLLHGNIIPKDDDVGRTASLLMRYTIAGDEGSIESTLENWMFTKPTGNPDDEDEQYVLEETKVTVRARMLKKELGGAYLLIGAQFTNQSGEPVVMTYLQDVIHQWTDSTHRPTVGRDININYFNMIMGVGKQLNLIKTKQVRFYLQTEGEIHLSSAGEKETKLAMSLEGGIELAGWQSIEAPVLAIKGWIHQDFYEDGTLERIWGAEIAFGIRLTKSGWMFRPGISISVYDTREDLEYEGDISYNTAIFFRFEKRTPYAISQDEEESIFEDELLEED